MPAGTDEGTPIDLTAESEPSPTDTFGIQPIGGAINLDESPGRKF